MHQGVAKCQGKFQSFFKVGTFFTDALEQSFPPADFHGMGELELRNVSDRNIHCLFEVFDVGEPDPSEFLLDPGEKEEIRRGQVRGVGWVLDDLGVCDLAEMSDKA